MGEEQVRQQLHDFLRRQSGLAAAQVVDVRKASLGRSREQWLFDAVWPDGQDERREPLILRRDPLGGLVETDRGQEYKLLEALEPSGLPSPKVRWLDADGGFFGRPSLIMRREVGSSDYFILNGDRPLDVRVRLAEELCDLLTRVHRVDWRTLGLGSLLEDPGSWASRAELHRAVTTLHEDRLEPYPELELAVDWLEKHAREASATVLVHADYKPGNVLFEDDRITALLDWELAHLGDPMEDLGWVTQPLREREHLIAGAWERSQLVERYRTQSGFAVDAANLRWWNVFATFRTAVLQVSGLRSYLEGRSDESYRPTAKVLSTLLRSLKD